MNTTLLPNGLTDLLCDEAEQEAEAIYTLMRFFKSLGYGRVKPPLIEFEESLLAGPGQSTEPHMFRLMDPISEKMMGVRADITPQIARIAASRFDRGAFPLRLAYAGDVLHVKGSQLNPARQFTQVGCELIGDDTIEADVESILTAIKGLRQINVKHLTLDMMLPALMRTILGTAPDPELMKALDNKNKEKITLYGGDNTELLLALASFSGDIEQSLQMLDHISATKPAEAEIGRLKGVLTGVQEALMKEGIEGVNITTTPLKRSPFDYYRGISYALYTDNAREAIARGGRYDFDGTAEQLSAIGFTIYMNQLRSL